MTGCSPRGQLFELTFVGGGAVSGNDKVWRRAV